MKALQLIPSVWIEQEDEGPHRHITNRKNELMDSGMHFNYLLNSTEEHFKEKHFFLKIWK
jgi:hypothetical protein